MSEIPAHLRPVAERMARDYVDDELPVLLAAWENANEKTTVFELLENIFRRSGYAAGDASDAARAVLAEAPIDLRRGLN